MHYFLVGIYMSLCFYLFWVLCVAHVKSRASTTGTRVIAGYGVEGSFDVLHPGLLVSLLLLSRSF